MNNKVVKAVLAYVKDEYGAEPEYLWENALNNAVLRHNDNKKWFAALLLETSRSKLGLSGDGTLDIINVKCDPRIVVSLLDGKRFLPGYHMNKEHWISIAMDGSVPVKEICALLDMSFSLTAKKKRK